MVRSSRSDNTGTARQKAGASAARPFLGLLANLLFAAALALPAAGPAGAAHAYAQFGDVRYPPGFTHWSYVDPRAPRGGEITLVAPTRVSNYDK